MWHVLKKLRLVLAAIVVVVVVFLFRTPPQRPVNVLLITLDTTRADRIGCYGYAAGSTPNIDRVAREGTRFDRAFATVPLTLPSHASIMTGLYPPEHGIRVNGLDSLPSSVTTLAKVLREQSYSTGAFVSSFVLEKKFGLNQGFQHYDDSIVRDLGKLGFSPPRDAEDVTNVALAWLENQGKAPFFCWVHYNDPHMPYDSHPTIFGERFQKSAYDGDVAFMDLHIGRLLKFLDQRQLDDNTLVIVIADHGESLGEHGERQHGTYVYNTTMQIPFVMRPPSGQKRESQVLSPVSQVDVLPTVLDYLNFSPRPELIGRSLKALVAGPEQDLERPIYMESLAMTPRHWAPQHVMLRGMMKLVRSPIPELFNLQADPAELHNLASSAPETAAELGELLVKMESKFRRRQGKDVGLSPREMANIAAGGYAAGPQQIQDNAEIRKAPDVKTMLPFFYKIVDARDLIPSDAVKAEAVARKVLVDRPDYDEGWAVLGTALNQQGRREEAVTALLRAIEIDHSSRLALTTLGDVRHAQKNFREAENLYQEVVRLRPYDRELRLKLAIVQIEAGKPALARQQLEVAAEIEPTDYAIRIAIAELLLQLGGKDDVRVPMETALSVAPNNAAVHFHYGSILSALGDRQTAEDQYRKATLLAQNNPRPYLELAESLSNFGIRTGALRQIHQALKLAPANPKAQELQMKWEGKH